MRITFLTQWFDPEPAQFRGLPLARELTRRGHEIQVITGFPNYPHGTLYPGYRIRPWQRETIEGVDVLRVPLYPSHDRNAARRIANYASFAASAATLGPVLASPGDVLYVYHPPPTVALAATSIKAAHKVPIVYHVADIWPESAVESGMLGTGVRKRIATSLINTYCNWAYRQCDELTVLSPGFKHLLVQRGVPAERIHVVYNWADDAMFQPQPPTDELARALGLLGHFNIIYAGNIGDYQGLDAVVRAAAMVRDTRVQVVFVGTGVAEPMLRELTKSLALTNVKFIGHQPTERMPAINAIADVLLVHLRDLPIFRVTIPGKVQVCLASERPLLAGLMGDAADLVRQSGGGIVVPPGDVPALADAMRMLSRLSVDERAAMARRGRTYYHRELSLIAGADKMEELFRRVSERRAA